MPASHTLFKCNKYRCTSPTFLHLLRATSSHTNLFMFVFASQIKIILKSYISLTRAREARLRSKVASRKVKGQNVTAINIVSCAMKKFFLPALRARRTISCLKKEGKTHMLLDERVAKRTRNKRGANNDPKRRVYAQICDIENKRRCVRKVLILAQNKKIEGALARLSLNLAHSRLKFSEAWLTNINLCWKLRS